MRTSTLDEVGDLKAEKGSRKWAIAARDELVGLLRDAEFSSSAAKFWFHCLEESEGWRHLTDERGESFLSFEVFCCYRKPFGLGYDRKAIEAIIREREEKEVAQLAIETPEARDKKGGRPRKDEKPMRDIGFLPYAGSKRLTARIARDHKAIHERMKRGEFKSVRAAAIEAGIIKPPSIIEQFKKLWRKASANERNQIRRVVNA